MRRNVWQRLARIARHRWWDERDAARAHHFGGMIIVHQRIEQMFERRIFMVPLRRGLQGIMEGLFEAFRKRRHGLYLLAGTRPGRWRPP